MSESLRPLKGDGKGAYRVVVVGNSGACMLLAPDIDSLKIGGIYRNWEGTLSESATQLYFYNK